MKQQIFTRSWTNLNLFTTISLWINAILALSLLLALIGWMQQRETVILVPPNMKEKVWVSQSDAAPEYKKHWGNFVASLIGNISPSNIEYVVSALSDIVSSEVYTVIKEQMNSQISDIKEDNIATFFAVEQIIYEEETDKVFVSGKSTVIGAGNAKDVLDRSFEFVVAIHSSVPTITWFDVYNGPAKTLAYLKTNPENQKK